jgi:hypothetical protein
MPTEIPARPFARPSFDHAEVFGVVAPPPQSGIDVTGLDPAEVLAALYNASQPFGMGWLNPLAAKPLTADQATQYLEANPAEHRGGHRTWYFDYLHGRIIKTWIGGERIDPSFFDRGNGPGAAAAAIATLRAAPPHPAPKAPPAAPFAISTSTGPIILNATEPVPGLRICQIPDDFTPTSGLRWLLAHRSGPILAVFTDEPAAAAAATQVAPLTDWTRSVMTCVNVLGPDGMEDLLVLLRDAGGRPPNP